MNAQEILKQYQLKRTSCREGIIDVVKAANEALSESEIKEQLQGNYDRTTFYRSFKTLEECHILHKIVIDNHWVKYALNNDITHRQEHAHFYCKQCHSVRCMESTPTPQYALPKGFSKDEIEVIIKGICANCKALSE